jgi:hypothetical protein
MDKRFNATFRYSTFASHFLTLSLAVCAALVSYSPFRHKSSWMLYEEDEFFYYLKIAFNLSHGHGSSFNGIVSTNGYHPLWLCLLAAVSRLSTNDSDLAIRYSFL